MKRLAILALTGLLAAAILACGGDSADPTAAPATTAAAPVATEPPPAPTNTPAPEPTDAPEPTATAMPEPTSTAVADPTATAEPQPTATSAPEPTATPEPQPTSTPEPTATATPEPTATEPPEPLIATSLAALGNNLLWVAHFDSETQRLSAYNPSGTFTPEQALPPMVPVPDPSEIGMLTELMPSNIYTLMVRERQDVELNGRQTTLWPGINQFFWR